MQCFCMRIVSNVQAFLYLHLMHCLMHYLFLIDALSNTKVKPVLWLIEMDFEGADTGQERLLHKEATIEEKARKVSTEFLVGYRTSEEEADVDSKQVAKYLIGLRPSLDELSEDAKM